MDDKPEQSIGKISGTVNIEYNVIIYALCKAYIYYFIGIIYADQVVAEIVETNREKGYNQLNRYSVKQTYSHILQPYLYIDPKRVHNYLFRCNSQC